MPVYDIVIRILLAVLIGGAIGYEREFKNRPAGFRTHILVCIGATVISLIQQQMANTALNNVFLHPELANVLKVDYARLGAQVITGVGFLGAGTIIHNKGAIRGLTTAASIWVVACVGLAIGMGYYEISIIGGVTIVLVLGVLKKFQSKFITQAGIAKFEITYIDKEEALKYVNQCMFQNGIKIKNIEFAIKENEEDEEELENCLYTVSVPKSIDLSNLVSRLSLSNYIVSTELIDE
ncbi:putative Mg2+ transporter-C (MgtC) family protein [Clostridium moniliforme]|uniref:Mg2+ transporter-C (MgtC) family protein n=2 Tax=Eubacteriales TaxID=186802 RepID=A0ABT9UWI3_9FIRM|nr:MULTISPECIES: MgtC/SapB family protein [Eubacteriales]MBP1890884.1 putative Mg2+ transporter-C (MgtC) family protein [Clostridium moniliforme]MDQ0150692.1 putative Mg2+ transporter-C (MgtC) family protein [Eubacterium multiforme]